VISQKGWDSNQPSPLDLPDATTQLETVGSRFRVDVKAKVTPLVERHYGFDTDEASGSLTRNAERARDLKRDRAFVNGENGLPYRHPIIQQAINVIWFSDRRSEGVMFPNEFNPIPYEAIALVLAVVRKPSRGSTRSKAKPILTTDRVLPRRVECTSRPPDRSSVHK
jgi:hypothetical protein